MKSFPLTEVPDDAMVHILDMQSKIKKEKKVFQYSQSKTIIAIIREHKKLMDINNIKR